MTPPENPPSEKPPTKPTLWGHVNAFLNSKPWGFLGWLISLLLTLYLFFAGQQKPLLVYAVWPIHAPIVRSQSVGDLKVLYKGAEIPGDISVATVTLENQGAAAILGAPDTDILAPIYIQLEGNARILEASVQKNEKSRPLIGVSLDQSEANAGRLGLGWKILEQNDGFVVQITYAGSINTGVQVIGEIKGQRQGLVRQEFPSGIWTTAKEYNTALDLNKAEAVLILLGFVSLVSMITLYCFFYGRKIKRGLEPQKLRLIQKAIEFRMALLTAMSAVCVIMGIFFVVIKK